jgi:hypothetical protein
MSDVHSAEAIKTICFMELDQSGQIPRRMVYVLRSAFCVLRSVAGRHERRPTSSPCRSVRNAWRTSVVRRPQGINCCLTASAAA